MNHPVPLQALLRSSRVRSLFLLLAAFAFWGVRPLWDPDEGRYAECARIMAVSGDWLVPHLGDHPHLTKPPMAYWLTALGLKVFGVNPWGARFFLCAAYLGTVLCAMQLVKCWGWRDDEAACSGLVLATSALFFVSGHALTTDMFLTFFETLGLLCLWRVWTSAPGAAAWRIGFWVAFGLAFLTKGPPGWIPLLAIAIHRFLGRRQWDRPRIFSLEGFLLFILLSAGWFAAVIVQDPERFRHFVVDEFVNRIATTEHKRNNPFFIYPFVIAGGALPWLWLWPEGWRRLREAWCGGFAQWSEPARFSAAWFGTGFVIFTLARSRLPLYVVPIFVIVALWEGRLLAGFDWNAPGRIRRIGRWMFPCAAALWFALMLGMNGAPPSLELHDSLFELGGRIKREVSNDQENARLYWVGNLPPKYSAAFYSGIRMNVLTENYEDAPRMVAELPDRRTHPVILVMRSSRIDRMDVHVTRMGRVIRKGKYSAIVVNPEWSPDSTESNDETETPVSAP